MSNATRNDWFHYCIVGAAGAALMGILAVSSGCTPQQAATASAYQQQIAAACATASAIGAADPAVGIYIVAGCSTESAIAKLALDPNSLNWVNGLIADVKKS